MSALVLSRVLCSDTGAAPPTEFRIFPAGRFSTTKGEFLFDGAAATSVMAAYQAQGVDVMIDLEHLALGALEREDASDARGWFQLALRKGELWAVNVRWTPDGTRRLTGKTQRYTSPAFIADADGRIQELVNVALVAMPATHGAPALVAAARACAPTASRYTVVRSPQRVTKLNMTPESIKAALDALEKGDAPKALELLKQLIADAASGGAAGDVADTSAEDALSDTAAADPSDGAADPKDEMAALRKQVATLSANRGELAKLRAEVARLTAADAEEEQTERLALVAGLVKLGVETPALAFAGKPDAGKLSKRLQDEPIAELRERVKTLSATAPKLRVTPPVGSTTEPEWTESEAKAMAKMSPEKQAEYKALRLSRRK